MTIEYDKVILEKRYEYPEKPPIKIIEEYTAIVPELPIPGLVERRMEGEFKDRAYFLCPKYDWIIGIDSLFAIVLIPMKKDKTHE